ncbi:MAG: hypothetical protein HQ567_24655 [Candidatus Nealsonbacteria bacterium]|nr:hypothetical protein [Candidatus Nealsonbacteria bacterium]
MEIGAAFNQRNASLTLLSLDTTYDGRVQPFDVRARFSIRPLGQRTWQDAFPKLGFDEILRQIVRADRRQEALDPWSAKTLFYAEEVPTEHEERLLRTATAYEQFIEHYGRDRFCRIAAFKRESARHFVFAFVLDAVPGLERLLCSNPVLAFMTVMAALRQATEADAIDFVAGLLSLSERAIAEELGVAHPNVLRRVHPSAVTENRLMRFSRVYHEESRLRTVSHHLRDLRAPILTLLGHPVHKHLGNRFLMELRAEPDDGLAIARGTISLFTLLRQFKNPSLPVIERATQAHRLIKAYYNCVPHNDLETFFAAKYPHPPLGNTSHIRGLDSPRDLLRDSWDQGGLCAGQVFGNDVKAGRTYFYQVLPSPGISQRATMQLVPGDEGEPWRIETIVLRENRQPPLELVEALAAWVARQQGISDIQSVAPAYVLRTQKRLF